MLLSSHLPPQESPRGAPTPPPPPTSEGRQSRGWKTNLVRVNENKSPRTTVPASMVRQFCLGDGDQIEWKIQAQKGKFVTSIDFDRSVTKCGHIP